MDLADKYRQLTPNELQALFDFNTTAKVSSLTPTKAESLYALFLHHRSCEEIVRMNKGISLGQVIDARIQNRWDARRAENIDNILDHVQSEARLAQAKMAGVIADLLGISYDIWKEKIDLYLQTKDKEHLSGLPVGGAKTVKELLDMLASLTQPTVKNAAPTIIVNNNPAASKPDPKNTVTVTVEKVEPVSSNPILAIAKRLKSG